jgi:hypothetical protein
MRQENAARTRCCAGVRRSDKDIDRPLTSPAEAWQADSGTGLLTGAISKPDLAAPEDRRIQAEQVLRRPSLPNRTTAISGGLQAGFTPGIQPGCAHHSCGAVAESHRASQCIPLRQAFNNHTLLKATQKHLASLKGTPAHAARRHRVHPRARSATGSCSLRSA